jgi:hypothetical protein
MRNLVKCDFGVNLQAILRVLEASFEAAALSTHLARR